ncbi:MAG: hypothetical protein KAS22_04290 [Candidatus Heimdallarchaeota archaeon]|nr:hypothetical protein [Candidatus Heimdallarchaeota archaeon]MCK5157524.1 hypothetical protein [Candidatus Heimdallarchaeota archaeon]
MMDYTRLIGKIAVDKENEKLGRIKRIESMPGKTIKKNIPYVMIIVKKFFKKTVVVPIEAEKVTKVEGNYVWFSITKSEFTEEVQRIRKIITEREISAGTRHASDRRSYLYGMDHSRVSPKRKERKR